MAVDNLLYRAADEGNRIAGRLPSLSRQNFPRTMALLRRRRPEWSFLAIFALHPFPDPAIDA